MQPQLQQRQCPTSEALGQRSANRGECAQACRLPYQLIVDGEERDLQDQRYLLSPQDLSAWELLLQLEQIGIASFKIEGRLKEATYVAAVTDAYRQGLDRLAEGLPSAPQSAEQRSSLELSFSRGLSKGWLGASTTRLSCTASGASCSSAPDGPAGRTAWPWPDRSPWAFSG